MPEPTCKITGCGVPLSIYEIGDGQGVCEDHLGVAVPTWEKPCEKCGATIARYRGGGDVTCQCGAEYNAGGQRLRDDWRGNPSTWDDEVSDLDGFERQHQP